MPSISTSPFNTSRVSSALGFNTGIANPFLDLASEAMPEQNKNALEWSEYIYDAQETYRSARERAISYFLTDVEVNAPDPRQELGADERDKFVSFMNDTLGIMEFVQRAARDREVYGNSFVSLMVPFKRFLVCPKCGSQFLLREMYENKDTFNFSWQIPEFTADCPSCKVGSGYRGTWQVNDLPEDLETKLKLKLWSPHEIEILHDLYTDDTNYVWRIPEDYKRQIRTGYLYQLERASMQVIKAIHNNNLFLFNPEVLHHIRVPVISGRRHRGWGFSPILMNFRQIWYVQVLRRYNEAIGLDYIIPFRLITPEARPGTGSSLGDGSMSDPLRTLNMGDYSRSVMSMIRKRRTDPGGWNFLPFPVQYQALGGDAKALAPAEILDQATDVMLNGAGTFSELYRGTLQLQSAPVSLRLYEAVNQHLVHDMNGLLQWVADQAAQVLSWERVSCRLRSVTHVDDATLQMAKLQLMMGQQISGTTGLQALGISWDEEQRRKHEEARRQLEMQAKTQEEMEQQAFGEQIAKGQPDPAAMAAGGAMPPGGAAAPPGGAAAAGPAGAAGGAGGDPAAAGAMGGDPAAMGAMGGSPVGQLDATGVPQSLDEMMQLAEDLAAQLLALPATQRNSELRALKDKNEALWSLTKTKVEQIRNRAQTAGGAMLLGEQPPAPM